MPAFTPGYIHDWDKNVPSGSSVIQQGDDLLRSDKSILEGALNAEHYFNDDSASSRSAGEHRPGSARIFIGDVSELSNPEFGRLFYRSNATDFSIALSSSTWSTIGIATIGKLNNFAVQQNFVEGLRIFNSAITFGSDVNLYRGAANVLQTDDALWASSISAPSLDIEELSTSTMTAEVLALEQIGSDISDSLVKGFYTERISSLVPGGGSYAIGAGESYTTSYSHNSVSNTDRGFVTTHAMLDSGAEEHLFVREVSFSDGTVNITFYNPDTSDHTIGQNDDLTFAAIRFA